MKNRFQIKSFTTAAFFLAAYLNVFATQASCNLPHFFEDLNKSYSDQGHSHNHHHDNKETTSHHNDEDTNHHNEKGAEKDDNCCNDKTSAFFANQGNHVISSVDFKNTSVTEYIFVKTIFVCNSEVFDSENFISYSLPPPKIPDIRIFIHSFII